MFESTRPLSENERKQKDKANIWVLPESKKKKKKKNNNKKQANRGVIGGLGTVPKVMEKTLGQTGDKRNNCESSDPRLNTLESPGELKTLTITQTPVKPTSLYGGENL